ncbi:hypothetical protein DXG01_013445, partial [Tephrocybe rancida]
MTTKATTKKGAAKKKSTTKTLERTVETVQDVVFPNDMDFDVPSVTQVHITPASSPEPRVVTPPPTPPPTAYDSGLCEDDEDAYFLK